MSEENVFEKMSEEQPEKEVQEVQTKSASGEIDFNSMSNVPVAKEYVRSALDGKEVSISAAKVFAPKHDDELFSTMNKTASYYKVSFVIEYDHKNADNMSDREYISGARLFEGDDVANVSFWYKGATNQSAKLWELVAAKKNIPPEELDRRQFLAFLNSGIKVKIVGEKISFKGKDIVKNLVGEIL